MPNLRGREFKTDGDDFLSIEPHNSNSHVEFFVENPTQERWAAIDITSHEMLTEIRDFLTAILEA